MCLQTIAWDLESLNAMPRSHMLEDLPWYFLRKLMALNGTARNTGLVVKAEKDSDAEVDDGGEMFCLREMDTIVSVNPLDVPSAVLLCSDSFLEQEILLKMTMCHFVLPLNLPPFHAPKCTFMLWAMRDIVRKWRPHSLAESRGFKENLVFISMPNISFVQIGNCSLSTSKLFNEVLSSRQHHHNFFIHLLRCSQLRRDRKGGGMSFRHLRSQKKQSWGLLCLSRIVWEGGSLLSSQFPRVTPFPRSRAHRPQLMQRTCGGKLQSQCHLLLYQAVPRRIPVWHRPLTSSPLLGSRCLQMSCWMRVPCLLIPVAARNRQGKDRNYEGVRDYVRKHFLYKPAAPSGGSLSQLPSHAAEHV
ncbi:uncharacterized protein LOC133365908 [Rhineura floridana]|uniref:uncharacterized protein LOC133365908 n=1 Tax=Rhineura floridana TaxID=261503 RepID=UPI002AC8169A|nr:uncharacterized protein LOC133365908 [Rhineura floridana]